MTYLADVNVLIALAWPSHVHHAAAHAWFAGVERFATSSITQLGFVRVSANPRVLQGAVSVAEARGVLAAIEALPQHELWTDDLDFGRDPQVGELNLVGPRQTTDAHLLALAARRGGRLATLDRRIQAIIPDRSPLRDALALIPV